jgi:hypothetical protein
MKLLSMFGCVALAAVAALPAHAQQKDNAGMKYALPDDPKAAVIVLDFKGGFTPPRTSDEPTMTIRAGGSVEIPARFAGQKAYKGELTREDLQELLAFIIEKQEFFKYDAAKVREKLGAGGLRPQVADAATTVIRVTANGETKEVSHYALGFGAKVKELDQLSAIQQRLMRVQAVVQLGGKAEIGKWLELVNAELKKLHPDVAPFTADNLQHGGDRGDGSIYVSFARSVGDDPATAKHTSAFVIKPVTGDPKITVTHR